MNVTTNLIVGFKTLKNFSRNFGQIQTKVDDKAKLNLAHTRLGK